MARRLPPPDLAATLADALALLDDYADSARPGLPAEPLPSLLAECEALCAEPADPGAVGMLHHFACTGGTLIAKCVAALPNTVLLSEIDPLSTLSWVVPRGGSFVHRHKDTAFRPTDLILALRVSLRAVPEPVLAEVFAAGVAAMRGALARHGLVPVIRDHAHSHFCSRVDPDARPTVREILAPGLPVRSVVTVRHPVDSFLALEAQGWRHFQPFTIDDYARRYLLFLDRHAGLPIVRYEAFVADPGTVLAEIARHLGLAYSPLALELFAMAELSGDSGRKGGRIAPRPPRPVPEGLSAEIGASEALAELCLQLGYAPDRSAG